MIIYNKTWLANAVIVGLAEEQNQQGLLSDTELQAIRGKYPVGFYTPNIFIRIGLFLVTVITAVCFERLVNLILFDSGLNPGYRLYLILGLLNYVALWLIVKKKSHYRSGVDDGLLLMSFIWLLISIEWLQSDNYQARAIFIFLLSLYFALRFSDMLMSCISYLSLTAFLYFTWQKLGPTGISTMPFALMLYSGVIYLFVSRNISNIKTRFYVACMITIQVLTLITFYVAGNYFVVKEVGEILNHTKNETMPLNWFFWIWTTMLPAFYVYRGIVRKDRISLRVGLLLCIAAAITVRHYYNLMPLELLFILTGIILIVLVWYVKKYLKTPRHGITDKEPAIESLSDQLKLESLVISDSSSHIGIPPADTGTQMGGGRFGGGGASGTF
ncbi:MAG: hypothetical protein V4721_08685 [Bacteroidota bacterium]